MKKYIQVRKKLVVGLIALFLSITVLPITGSLPVEKEHSIPTKNWPILTKSWPPRIHISGAMGENGWYVGSTVTVVIDTPPRQWYFRIDGGAWDVYMGPFQICGDGIHLVEATHDMVNIYSAVAKMDCTLPEISLIENFTGIFKVNYIANVSDETSGVWRVEFYVDDEPMFTDFDFPFESPWVWSRNHNVVATVFDFAGNSDINVLSTPYVLRCIQNNLHTHQIIKILLTQLLRHEIFVKQLRD